MSLALIEESAKEVRRLAIAGSPLALGDFRLKKLVAPLEQAGAKVPVFAQVAKAIDELINGKEADSASRLLNLSTLLNAILYTQGNSTATGDFRELDEFATNCSCTKTTARVLKPLMQALTSSGSGRFEIIKSAVERGAMTDLRLIDPAILALGDNYPELADLVAEKVLPAFGPGIVPRLKSTFIVKGKRNDARKLTVMHQLDPGGTLELCKTALDDGSPDVKAAAIECLGHYEESLPLVFEQVNSKNKQLRMAALSALAQHDRAEVTKIFTELIQGKSLDILVGPFRAIRNRAALGALLAEGKRVFDLVAKGESEQLQRFWEILDCLEPRKEPEVQEFLIDALANSEKIKKTKAAKNTVNTGEDIVVRLAEMVYSLGTPKAFSTLLEKRNSLPAETFSQVLRAAMRTWPPEKVFEEFSPLLAETKGAGKDKNDSLQLFISAALWDDDSRYDPLAYLDQDEVDDRKWVHSIQWDPRWLDAAIKANQHTVVCCLARPNHKGAIEYLLKAGAAKKSSDGGQTIRGLTRCQYPKVTEFFLELVAKKAKGAKHLDYELQFLFEKARFLPAADLPKLEAFASTLDEKFADHFLEAIAPLRPSTQPN